jgi:hypothetical protein
VVAPYVEASPAKVARVNFEEQPPSRLSAFSGKAVIAALFATIALTLGGGAVAQATTPPDTTPPATEAPVTTPDTVAPVTIPGTIAPDDGGDDIDWGTIILVTILGIAVIALIIALMSRRKPTTAGGTVTPTASSQSEILSTAQWIHDQLSLELLAAAPAAALQRWTVERTRVDNVAIRAQQQFTQGYGEAWQSLGSAMSQLGTSLDTVLQLRNQQPPNAQLIQQANDVVGRRRADLQLLLTAIWPTVQP